MVRQIHHNLLLFLCCHFVIYVEIWAKLNIFALVPKCILAEVRVEVSTLVFGLELIVAHRVECEGAHGVHEELDAKGLPLVPAKATNLFQSIVDIVNFDDSFFDLVAQFIICLLVSR